MPYSKVGNTESIYAHAMVWDTHSTPCLRNIQNLLLEFLRKLHFENVIKMVTECLRLQEIGVDFLKIFLGVAPHTPPPPPVAGVTPPTPSPRWPSATYPIAQVPKSWPPPPIKIPGSPLNIHKDCCPTKMQYLCCTN